MGENFKYTGNPIVDNGMTVLAVICGVEDVEKITKEKIKENIDSFFESIKTQYNDLSAAEKEKKHAKKKLKQHLTGLYTTNHYLHGINNKVVRYQLLITVDTNIDVKNFKEYKSIVEIYKKEFTDKDQAKKEEQKIKGKKIKNVKIKIDNNKLIIRLNVEKKNNKLNEFLGYIENNGYKHVKTVYSKIFSNKKEIDEEKDKFGEECVIEVKKVKKTVETNEEYFKSFKDEVTNILDGKSNILIERREDDYNCIFCGKKAEIRITKDLFPLTSSIEAWNLGKVYSCRYCYLATLFYFFNLVNLKKDKKSSGIYFFYHFSNPKVMIENAKLQINYLRNNTLGSLQTIIGGKYSSAFKDLYEKTISLGTVLNENPSSVTIYFLLNDNRGAQYDVITIPDGLLNFYLALNTPELSNQWAIIQSFLNSKEDYINFANGIKNIWNFRKDNFPVLKNKTVKIYLKEVSKMDENVINAIEDLSMKLKEYYQKMYNVGTKKRKNWLEDFYDFFDQTKPFNFFSNLLKMNNEYFKISGSYLINIDNLKIILSNSKRYNLMFYLIEFFILNSLSEDEKTLYLKYAKEKKNINE